MAKNLDDVLKDLTDESTALDALIALKAADENQITDLKTQLAAALANTTISPAVQSQIDAIFAAAEANKAKIAAAMPAQVAAAAAPDPAAAAAAAVAAAPEPTPEPQAADPATTPVTGQLATAFASANPAVQMPVTVQQAVTWWNQANPGQPVPPLT